MISIDSAMPVRRPVRPDRKVYILWMAAIWAAVISGFGLDFSHYMGETPPPPLVLHLHAAVYMIWLVLVSVQIFLVETGDIRRHKTLGWATAIVSVSMVPIGLAAAFVDQVRQIGTPHYAPQFLALEFEEVFCFAAFVIAGILWRRNYPAHKRLMILAAVAISDAGFARLWGLGFKIKGPAGPFGWWLHLFWGIELILVAMAAWDLWTRRKIHPALMGGAALLLTGQAVATALDFSPAWKSLMVSLVNAWGYGG